MQRDTSFPRPGYDDWSAAVDAALPHFPGAQKAHGEEITLQTCPACGESDWKWSINRPKGAWQCMHASCGAKGGVRELYALAGLDWHPAAHTAPLTRPSAPPAMPESAVLPLTNMAGEVDAPLPRPALRQPSQAAMEAAAAALQADPVLIDHLRHERGLTRAVIEEAQLGVWTDGRGVRWLTIPHVEAGVLRCVKRRRLDSNDKPKYLRTEDSESVLYGADLLGAKPRRVYLCEGELDALALRSAGLPFVLAGTLGAGHVDDAWLDQLAAVTEIVLVPDNDEAGAAGARAWAEAFGLRRTSLVTLPAGKDAGEWCARHGGTAEGFLKLPLTQFDVDHVAHVRDALEAHELFGSAAQGEVGLLPPWPALAAITGYWMPGHVIVVGAREKTGKSTFALQAAKAFALDRPVEQAVPTLFFTLEMPFYNVGEKLMVAEYSIIAPQLTREHRDGAKAKWEQHPLWLTTGSLQVNIDTILTTTRAAVARYGVRFVVVDNLHLLIRDHHNEASRIGEAMRGIKLLANELALTILVLSQCKKAADREEGRQMITIDDLKGSVSIATDADQVLLMWRESQPRPTDPRDFTPGPQDALKTFTHVRVERSRYSAGGTLGLHLVGEYSRFVESAATAASLHEDAAVPENVVTFRPTAELPGF